MHGSTQQEQTDDQKQTPTAGERWGKPPPLGVRVSQNSSPEVPLGNYELLVRHFVGSGKSRRGAGGRAIRSAWFGIWCASKVDKLVGN